MALCMFNVNSMEIKIKKKKIMPKQTLRFLTGIKIELSFCWSEA